MCTPLKHALVDHPDPAWKVGSQAGILDVRISMLSQGRATPRDWEISRLSEILGKPAQELFPEPNPQVAA